MFCADLCKDFCTDFCADFIERIFGVSQTTCRDVLWPSGEALGWQEGEVETLANLRVSENVGGGTNGGISHSG